MENSSKYNSFRSIFKTDIKYIVETSIKIRWCVGIGVLILPNVLTALNLYNKPVSIYISGIFIILYNAFYYYLFKKKCIIPQTGASYNILLMIGRTQIIPDFLMLLIILYFIGGLHTSLFYILIFHLIIGSIILSKWFLYGIAAIASFSFYLFSILEFFNIIPYHNLYYLRYDYSYNLISIETLARFGIFFSTVFLTSQLTNRIKSDNIRLIQFNNDLEVSLENLRVIEQRKSQFLRYSAHQLRSPLGTIISAQNVLIKKMVPLDSERAFNLLLGANEKAKSLLELVIDLLELSRIKEIHKKIDFQYNVNLVKIIEEILYSLNEKISLNGLSVHRRYECRDQIFTFDKNFRYKEDFDANILGITDICIKRGNLELLKEGFYNIIHNAIKYSNHGGNIYINIRSDDTDKTSVRIKDEGIGIDPEFINDIFNEFVRSPNAKEKISEGTGLGLSISQEIFNNHGAGLSVESDLNKGATFTVTFMKN